MIQESVASRQVLRFKAQRNYPTDELAVREIIAALKTAARNAEHAGRIVDHCIGVSPFCPAPADIHASARITSQDSDFAQPDKKCGACGGTGFEPAWELVTHEGDSEGYAHKAVQLITDPVLAAQLRSEVDGRRQNIYSGVRRCHECGYGRALAAAEHARGQAA